MRTKSKGIIVRRTITSDQRGKFQNEDGSWFERRYIPGAKTWEAVPTVGPETLVYGSPEHQAAQRAGRGGGTIKWETEGVKAGEYHLTQEEAEALLTRYASGFATCIAIAHGELRVSGGNNDTVANMMEARRYAQRAFDLFDVDLWDQINKNF